MRQNHTLLKEGLRFDRTKTPTSPENLRGGAISPKAPCQQTRTAAKTDHRRKGPPQRRTARRSFPISEALRATIQGSYHKLRLARAPPSPHRATAHAGRRVGGPSLHGASSVRRRLIGVARKSFPNSEVIGLQSKVPTTNSASPEHLRGGAISPKAPCLRTRTAAKTGHRRNGSPQRRTARRSFPT